MFFDEATLLKNSGGFSAFWHAHDLTFAGENIHSQSQIFILFASKVEQQ